MNKKSNKLYTLLPREVGGSQAAQGLDFQRDWSICKLLELHSSGKDYVIICEHHDDVLVLDSDDESSMIEFYQVKKKKGGKPYTIHDLIKKIDKKKNEKSSILSKLYTNKILFEDKTKSLNLVSNAALSCSDVEISAQGSICVDNLSESDISRIREHLKLAHNLTEDPDFRKITYYIQTQLSPEDPLPYLKGKIIDFLGNINPEKKYAPSAIQAMYTALFGEIKRRGTHQSSYGSFEEFKEKKGISKKSFQKMVSDMGTTKDYDTFWISIENRLNSEDEKYTVITKLKKDWIVYQINLMDPTNFTHQALCDIIKELYIKFLKEHGAVDKITSYTSWILGKFSEIKFEKKSLFSDSYIKAVAIAQLYVE